MNSEQILMVLREPHTSEKTTIIADKLKQYTFRVLSTATKLQVKLAVEKMFNTKVANVRIINVKGKTKRFRNTEGQRSNWKKAYVALQPNCDIDLSVSE